MSGRRLAVVSALVAASGAAACAVAPADAPASRQAPRPGVVERVERASLGEWSATLRLRLGSGDRDGAVRGIRLVVRQAGTTRLDRAIALPRECVDDGCVVPAVDGYRTLDLRRLDGRAPVAILWLWTGGAHCCSVVQAIELPGGRFTSRSFGNGGTSIQRLGGRAVFVAQDERFPYRYTSYAASGSPVQIFRLDGARFVDVTAEHLDVVQADAGEWWGIYLSARSDGSEVRGVFAAWAADACRLGRRQKVEARLADGVARGWFSPPRAETAGPHGVRYAADLMADLEALGYCAR